MTALGSGLMANGVFAQTDGFYNVSYNDLGIELTQIGAYGELTLSPSGLGDMGYGNCVVNFTRDESGAPKDYAAIVQQHSANCPEQIKFSIAPAADGLYSISFTEGGDLAGQTLDIFPVLQPMQESFKVTAPQGFDILGMTIGQSRAEIEAILKDKGYARLEGYTEKNEYQNGASQVLEIWGKGQHKDIPERPADEISLTYTSVFEGDEEKIEYLGRHWSLSAADNMPLATLKKSLEDKHGAPGIVGEHRYYDRAGNLAAQAFQPVCDKNIHLQSVNSSSNRIGMSDSVKFSPACGASVQVMTSEDYSAPGRAEFMDVKLQKADIAYEAFWNTWSRGEEASLKERYDLQANMTGAAPEL